MMAHYPQFLEQSGTPPAEILPVLLKAVELKPDNQDAWYNTALNAKHNFGAAWDAFSHITAERAYSLFSLKAHCYLLLKSTTLARQDAERAKQYAKTSDQQIQASSILHQLDLMEHPEQLQTAAPVLPNTAPDILRRIGLRYDDKLMSSPAMNQRCTYQIFRRRGGGSVLQR